MHQLFVNYYRERLNLETLITEVGFVCYRIDEQDPHLFLGEIYIDPNYRLQGRGAELIYQLAAIADQKGLPEIRAGVFNRPGFSEVVTAAVRTGFVASHVQDGALVLKFPVLKGAWKDWTVTPKKVEVETQFTQPPTVVDPRTIDSPTLKEKLEEIGLVMNEKTPEEVKEILERPLDAEVRTIETPHATEALACARCAHTVPEHLFQEGSLERCLVGGCSCDRFQKP